MHNTENISRENERGITSQKRQGKKNFDDGKSYQKGVVSYEELEKQTLGKLKEISRRYTLTDDEKEKKLSDFVERQEKDRRKFNELWEGFVSLSNEEKKKAILRIFFFAEFWDSSQDENEGAFRNIVWNKLCDLNAQDYIFKESVDYLIPFVSNPLVSMHMYENNNRLQRVLRRAKSSLLNDEMGNLIIKICIEIFNMRNTFNRGEFIKSGKVVECLSALKKFCEAGRKNKIADFELGDDQDCKIIYSPLGKKSKLNISSAIKSLIEKIKLKETEEKENTLEGFINDLRKSKKDLTQIYQCDQIKGFLKQHDYYLITFAIDEVIQYNESPLEEVLSIAKDHFSEEEMNAMLERACKYIVDQRNKSVEGVAFDSEKAFRLLSDKLNSINRKKEEILKFLVDKLGKIQDFSENCQSSTLQQTLEEVVSYSPSRGKNTGNRNHESCSKNFFDELTMILDGGKTDKQDKIQSFISSRLSRYKGNCFYRLLLGEFLFENQDHAQISQKYLLLHLDSQSIAFLLTAGQREKAKTTVLSIIDKSRDPVPNISSFAIDYRNLQIVNLEIDSRKSHLLDGIKKEDIEQGYKIKFIPINEEVISLDLLRKAIKDVGSRKQVIDNLKNIVNFINYTFNLDNDKIKFSFIRDESDAKNLVDGLLMGSKHEIPSDDKIINEIISSLVKNNIQAKSNNIRDHRLPIADKRSGKKGKKKAEYYAYLSREYGIFSSQADVRGDRAIFNSSAIRKNRKRPIINEEDYGCNALHLVIANEKFDDVKKLIDANEGYVKGRDFYGNTPLHFAVQAKNLEILQFLMDYIEKQNQKEGYFVDKNCDGCTPLHFAAGSGNVEFFSKLLKFVGAEAKEGYAQSKNNKGETPLHFAARSGKAEVVSKLLEFVDAKAKEGYVQSKGSKGETPLHFAARSGNVKVVEKLLEYVKDKEGYVKHENSNKCTPLHFAAWGSNVEVINKLLEFVGAEAKEGYVQSKGSKGETPLHFAAKKSNVEVILSLIGCVTEREGKENYVKCTNKLLYTPLHFAARSGNVEVINKLLEFVGAEAKEGYVQSKNNKGETPLHFAARSGNVKAVEKLLEYVKDEEGYVRAENNEKETSLHFAARSGNVEVINKLLEFVGAEAKEGYVQSKNNKGETPLHFAARSGNVKAVEKLLQFVGENEKENYIEFANNDNKNALDIAISYDSWEVFHELLKYIKNLEQSQYYLDLAKQASGSKKRNVYSLDDLQTKGRVEGRKKQRNKELITKKTHSHSEAVKDDNNPCSQSEGPTSSYSKKRPRISNGNTQKPPVKKVAQSDSPRQNVKAAEIKSLFSRAQEGYLSKIDDCDATIANARDDNGNTLLHFVDRYNRLDVMKELIKRAADLNTKNVAIGESSSIERSVPHGLYMDTFWKLAKTIHSDNFSEIVESIGVTSNVGSDESCQQQVAIGKSNSIERSDFQNVSIQAAIGKACADLGKSLTVNVIDKKVMCYRKAADVYLNLAGIIDDVDEKAMYRGKTADVYSNLAHIIDNVNEKAMCYKEAFDIYLKLVDIIDDIDKKFTYLRKAADVYSNLAHIIDNVKAADVYSNLAHIIDNVDEKAMYYVKAANVYQGLVDNIDNVGEKTVYYRKAADVYLKLAGIIDDVDKKFIYLAKTADVYSDLAHIIDNVDEKAMYYVKAANAYQDLVDNIDNVGEKTVYYRKAADVYLKLAGITDNVDKKTQFYKNAMKYHENIINHPMYCSDITLIDNVVDISTNLSNTTKDNKDQYLEISEKYRKEASRLKNLKDLRSVCNSSSRNWDIMKPYINAMDNVNEYWHAEGNLLHLAIEDGQIEVVKYLLKKGASVTCGSKGESTPLHLAAQKGHLDIVKMLLERNAAINAVDRSGRTALHLAAQEGHPDVVEKLLEVGAYSLQDRNGKKPLQLVVERLSQDPENAQLKKVQEILSNFGESLDESSLVSGSSCSQEVERTATNDISERSSGDEESVYSSPEQNSGSSLEQASNSSERNDLQSISLQGDNHDDDVNSKNKHGRTPLHDAVVNGNNEIVKTLLEGGASIDSKDKDGYTPLRLALANNEWEIVRILLEKVANDSNMLPIFNALNIEMQSPKTILNNVALDNQLRKRSLSF